MDIKKIGGNGSKATLPGGKKMTDFKKNPQTKKNSNLLTNGSGNNINNGNEEKPKSKGEQLAQNVGSEALKKSLKAAFPYIPQFVINKLVDSKLGQKVIEKTLNRTKKKMIFIIIGIVGMLFMGIFTVLMLYAIFAGPIMLVGEFAGKVAHNAGVWFKSFGNFMIGNGWCHDEDSCNDSAESTYYKEINFYSEQYKEKCGVSMNSELITATIFYDRMMGTEGVSSSDNDGKDMSESYDENTGYYKYLQKDINEIENLVDVYKNKSSSISCPLAGSDDFKKIIDDLKKVLGDYGYDASDLDSFLSKYKDKISDNVVDITDFYDFFSLVLDKDRGIFDEFLSKIKGVGSCFSYAFESLKGLFGVGINECAFNSDNYKNYLINYYIPNHYVYLMKGNYNMTTEEIADEIMLLGEINKENLGITIVDSTDGFFTMLPDEGNLHVTSNPANCRCHPINKKYESHKGVDIGGVQYGTKVLAFEDGVIASISIKTTRTCGSSIIKLKHTDEKGTVYYTRYVHLNRASNVLLSSFKVGDNVEKGQVIGYVGGTSIEDSCSTGPHLHFEVHDSDDNPINPLIALKNYHSGQNILLNKELIKVCSKNGASC